MNNASAANRPALTFRALVEFVAEMFAASNEDIATEFGITPEKAEEAARECVGALCYTGDEKILGLEGDYWQAWGDYQHDPALAVADLSDEIDPDALIFGEVEEAPAEDGPRYAIPTNHTTGKAYQGSNVETLAGAGFESFAFAGYGQWQEAGRQVRKGETSTTLIRVFEVEKDGKKERRVSRLSVFAWEQTSAMSEDEIEAARERRNARKAKAKTKKGGKRKGKGRKAKARKAA